MNDISGTVASPRPGSGDTPWRLERRATPRFGTAIAGGAGALIAIGVITIGVDLYGDHGHGPAWAGAGLTLAVTAGALLAMIVLPPLVRTACIAIAAIGMAATMAFLVFPRVHGKGDLRLFFAVTIVAWLVTYVIGPARARPLFLALALALGLSWAMVEVTHVNTEGFFPFTSVSSSGSSSLNDSSFTTSDTFVNGPLPVTESGKTNWGAMGGVALAFAFVYLLGVAVLDARGLHGVATAPVLPGVVALALAVSFFSAEASSIVVAGLTSVAAGLFCGTVGIQAHRRFMVWTGALFATVGAVFLGVRVGQVTTDNGSADHAPTVFGLFIIAFGFAMLAVALLVARLLREPTGEPGDEQPRDEPAGL